MTLRRFDKNSWEVIVYQDIVVCYYVVWYYDSLLDPLEFLAAELQPKGPGYQKVYSIPLV
jgi:hypothetical protein